MRLAMSYKLMKTFQLWAVSSYLGSFITRFRGSPNLLNRDVKSLVQYKVTLQEGNVLRVPLECREVHILSGVAWITVNGEDIILLSGETASLAPTKGSAVLSVLGNKPLTLEFLSLMY